MNWSLPVSVATRAKVAGQDGNVDFSDGADLPACRAGDFCTHGGSLRRLPVIPPTSPGQLLGSA